MHFYRFDELDDQVQDSMHKYHLIYAVANFVGRILYFVWNQGDIFGIGHPPMISLHHRMLQSSIHCAQSKGFSNLNLGRVLTQRKRLMPGLKRGHSCLPCYPAGSIRAQPAYSMAPIMSAPFSPHPVDLPLCHRVPPPIGRRRLEVLF